MTPIPVQGSPVPLLESQMAPSHKNRISSGSREMEHRYICLSEKKASHSSEFGQIFILCSTNVKSHLVQTSSQSVMFSKKPVTSVDCVVVK
jgi:hypothetical protein